MVPTDASETTLPINRDLTQMSEETLDQWVETLMACSQRLASDERYRLQISERQS